MRRIGLSKTYRLFFSGDFNHALLEDDSDCSQLLELYKNVAIKQVFSHPDVEQLELQGYRVISGLLDIYEPLLNIIAGGVQPIGGTRSGTQFAYCFEVVPETFDPTSVGLCGGGK
ncbi:Deoxyguanosinetriphosphate triphosphohydrolase [Klebsiella aerogenes]|nr:Deoxyguanosinetriphosphate triphosphohydrolase [Klebsiella aerogenes]